MKRKITSLVLTIVMALSLVPNAGIYVSASDYSDYVVNGLVLHYSFDSDASQPDTIFDDSGNGYNGTVLNTVEQSFGAEVSNILTVEGGVAHFPGSSRTTSIWGNQYHTGAAIKIPQEVKDEITGSFTVTMWVKADTEYEYHSGLQRLFDFGTGERDSIFLRYQGGSPAELRLQDRGSASGADDTASFVSGSTSAAEGQWTFVAAVYDAGSGYVSIYGNYGNYIARKNIAKFRSVADLEDVTNDTYGFFIGRTQWWANSSEKEKNPDFGGWIDDVRIYNKAVIAEELDILCRQTYHAPDMKNIVSGTDVKLRVKQGEAPELPDKVEVTFDDGSYGQVDVSWDEIPKDALDTIGAFTVRGQAVYNGVDYGRIMSAVITVTSPDGSLDDGLELYYSFENDADQPSSISDDSGNGRTGQVLNNTDRWNQRRITTEAVSSGRAARFPGGTWMGNGAAIKIPEETRANINGDYTISMWVKADSSYDFKSGLQRFFDFGSSTYNSIFMRYRVTDGDLRFQDRGIGNSADDKNSYISANVNSFVDSWGLISVTYTANDNTATVYVNGKEVMKGSGFTRTLGDIPDPTSDSYGMLLGRTMWQNSDNPDFCGLMDEVRIYSRALDEEEIGELFLTTCPEPMIAVNITHRLEDGTIIGTDATALAAEGSAYTYSAPATIEYNGKTYSLSYTLSTLSIKSVDNTNNNITAVYVIREITSQAEVSVEAYINTVPELPETVTLYYNTGETGSAAVKWMDIPANGWPSVGEYTVKGVADGFDVKATVTVYKITGTNVPEITYADPGSRPELPDQAAVYTTSGRTLTSFIEWDEIPEDKVSVGEDFEISGHLADFPDVLVETYVKFIFRAVKKVTAVADTYIANDNVNENHGSEDEITISSIGGSSGAAYSRYAFLRFENIGESQMIGAKLKLFMKGINNGGYTTFTLHSSENLEWDEYTLTMNTWRRATSWYAVEIAKASYQPSSYEETVNDWLEFDVSDYIMENPDKEYYDFYITASTCASYFSSREGDNPPVLEIESEGKGLTVRYVSGGEVIKTEKIAVPTEGYYVFEPQAAVVKDNRLYVSSGNVEITDTAAVEKIDVEMTETDYEIEDPTISTYYDEKPDMPSMVKVAWDGGEMELPVDFEDVDIDDIGVYTVYGDADGLSVKATVKAYGRYYNKNGALSGYAGRVNVKYTAADGKLAADTVKMLVRVGTSFDAETMTGYYPQLTDCTVVRDVKLVTEPEHEVVISGTLVDGVSGFMSAELSGDDPSAYTVNISAVTANTGVQADKAMIIIVKYDEDGKLIEFKTNSAALESEMTGRNTELNITYDYDRDAGEDIRIYLWDLMQLRPIYEPIMVSELSDPERYSEEILALIPEYDNVKENVLRANDYRQKTWSYNTWVNGIHPAFWDTAAYHTGNMEVYKTFGGEDYLDYSFKWAESNSWMGNDYSGEPDTWTWGYNQSQGSNAVLFGDWQTCFQTYLDLYMIDPDRADIERVVEVIDSQMEIDPAIENRGGAGYWWWADALYMVPPVYTKLYAITGNEEYLDKLYEYYRFAAELMYDGENGIPTSADGYTTAANRAKNGGSYYSDPESYAHLFYRDAGYAYPLNPNPGHTGEKNFWARGNGWVFAGLSKILADIPEDYENRDFFVTIYKEMAKAIIDCQMQDDNGRGFWTQSMLQNYPMGNNGNDYGYETSGTAFMTYGLFWGINNGMLDEDTYLEPALRGWKYLSEVALQDNGKVGYVQAIGSNATSATAKSSDQPFGYGAFLLAGCEASRWVEGFEK